jgi:hypothetical protein
MDKMTPPPPPRNKNRKPGLTAKGDQRQYVRHSYNDRSNEVIDNLTTSDENTLRLYREDSVGGPFPLKLQIVLKVTEKLGQQHIISWLPHGRSFMIHRPREFEEEVMGKFFKQTKLTSFRRQLNLYDFQRITHGRDAGSYYHELFLRGRPLLAKRMVRRKVKGTKIRASSSPDDEPNFYKMPPMGPIGDFPSGAMGGRGMMMDQDPMQSLAGLSSLSRLHGNNGHMGGMGNMGFNLPLPYRGGLNHPDHHQNAIHQQRALAASLQSPLASNSAYMDVMNLSNYPNGLGASALQQHRSNLASSLASMSNAERYSREQQALLDRMTSMGGMSGMGGGMSGMGGGMSGMGGGMSGQMAGLAGRDMAGLAGRDMAGLAGRDMAGLAGRDMAGLAGRDMAGLAGRDMAGLAGRDMAGLAGRDPRLALNDSLLGSSTIGGPNGGNGYPNVQGFSSSMLNNHSSLGSSLNGNSNSSSFTGAAGLMPNGSSLNVDVMNNAINNNAAATGLNRQSLLIQQQQEQDAVFSQLLRTPQHLAMMSSLPNHRQELGGHAGAPGPNTSFSQTELRGPAGGGAGAGAGAGNHLSMMARMGSQNQQDELQQGKESDDEDDDDDDNDDDGSQSNKSDDEL